MTETTPPTEATPQPCCEQMDVATLTPCAVCGQPTCKNCRSIVNLRPTCHACRDQKIEAQRAAEKPDASRVVTAVVGGAAGAVLGGIVWAAVEVFVNLNVGYVAVGVGVLAGFGTVLGAGGRKGGMLQAIGVVSAVFGLALGKYFTVAHAIINNVEEFADASYFDSQLIGVFAENLSMFVSGFDLLWLFLALGAAFKIPAPTGTPTKG